MKPVVFPMIRCPDVWGAGMDAGRCPHPSLPLTTCARRNLAGGLPKGTAPGLILFAQVLLYLAATASLACSSTSGVAGSSITWRSYISDRARLYSLGKTLTNLERDRKSTRLNSSHSQISYAVFCLKKKKKKSDNIKDMTEIDRFLKHVV